MRYEIYFHFLRSFCPNEESHPVQTMTSGCDNLPKETLVFRECVHIFGLRHPSERYIGHFSKKESRCLDIQCHNSCSSIITSHRETALFSKVLHQELFTYPVENFFYSAQLHKSHRYRSKEVSLSKECDATII